jgi:FMN phosphatase YigB (HAD superfamily)
MTEIEANIAHSFVSFDIWDTVLRRKCHPEQIKLQVSNYIAGGLGSSFSGRRVYLERLKIEQALAKKAVKAGNSADCNFLDVHRELVSWSSRVSFASDDQIAPLLEKEVELEIAHTYVDQDALRLIHAARAQGTKVAFISDFYMPKPWLSCILDAHGLLKLFDTGYVSVDFGKTKHDGTLFRHVAAAEGVRGPTWRHYGDNAHSDVHQAKLIGIDAVHFVPEPEHTFRREREAQFQVGYGLTRSERMKLRLSGWLGRSMAPR